MYILPNKKKILMWKKTHNLVGGVPHWTSHSIFGSQTNPKQMALSAYHSASAFAKVRVTGYKRINPFIWDTFRKKLLKIEKVESFWESL